MQIRGPGLFCTVNSLGKQEKGGRSRPWSGFPAKSLQGSTLATITLAHAGDHAAEQVRAAVTLGPLGRLFVRAKLSQRLTVCGCGRGVGYVDAHPNPLGPAKTQSRSLLKPEQRPSSPQTIPSYSPRHRDG